MKKLLPMILALILCFTLCSCGGSDEPAELSVEDAYAQLTSYAAEGQYLDGWRIVQAVPEVLVYEDGQAYYDYCEAMRAYSNGGVGIAYSTLLNIPDILDAQDTISILDESIGSLNGYYVADNGIGSYLHLVIKNGLAAAKVIGYTDPEQTFAYTDSDFTHQLVSSAYTDGTEFIALGRYSSLGEKLTINYAINTFDDSNEIMVIAFEGSEFTTFNGLYSKVAEVE